MTGNERDSNHMDLAVGSKPRTQTRAHGAKYPSKSSDIQLEDFFKSRAMLSLLDFQVLEPWKMGEAVLGAPTSLMKKKQAFQALLDGLRYPACGDGAFDETPTPLTRFSLAEFPELSLRRCLSEIETAINELRLGPGEIFFLHYGVNDVEAGEVEYFPEAAFSTLDAALQHAARDRTIYEWDATVPQWGILEKWVPGGNGAMDLAYRYFLIEDYVAYFEKCVPDAENNAWKPETHVFSGDCGDLNLPVPFEPGDIVVVDCMPYAPPISVAILEVCRSECDCCFPSTIYRDRNGLWKTGALKHNHRWDYCDIRISPLYRIDKHVGPLSDEESLLLDICRYVDGSEARAEALWDEIFKSGEDGLTDSKLLAIIRRCDRERPSRSFSKGPG